MTLYVVAGIVILVGLCILVRLALDDQADKLAGLDESMPEWAVLTKEAN